MAKRSIRGRFLEFHSLHPEVYTDLLELANEMYHKGWRRYAICTLWEISRWHQDKKYGKEDAPEAYKLNDNYRAYYARLLMENNPHLQGFFETRKLRSEARKDDDGTD